MQYSIKNEPVKSILGPILIEIMKLTTSNKIEKIAELFFLIGVFILPFSIAFMEVSFSIAFVTWLIYKIIKRENLSKDRSLLILIGLFLVSSSVSGFYSGYPILFFRGMIKIIKYSLVFLIAADFFQDERRLKRLLLTSLISFSFIIADSLVQRVNGIDLIRNFPIYYTDLQVRLTGPYKSYGLLGAHLLALMPITLSLIWAEKKSLFKKIILILLFITSLYVLYKTHSRGAWLASFAGWFVYAFLIKNRFMFIVLVSFLFIVPFTLPKGAIIHLDIQRKEQSLFERYRLLERALQVTAKRPLFGCGINTYIKNYPLYDEVKNWRVPGYYAHNGYLQLAAETGLVSLALFLLLVWNALKNGYSAICKFESRKRYLSIGAFTACLALLLQAVSDTTLHNLQTAVMIWLSLGVLVALNHSYKIQHEFNKRN